MSEKPIIIVFQMAKVASLSWYEAIRAAEPAASVFHLHFVSNQSLDFIRSLGRETGPSQTIKRLPLLLRLGTLPTDLADRFANGRWVGGPVRVVTGVRDPVGRAMSALLHTADFVGHRTVPLAFREGAEIDSLLSVFRQGWAEALGAAPSADSFGRLVAFLFAQYRSWFDMELKSAFAIDARHAARRIGRQTWQIAAEGVEVLIYRQEDLARAELVEEARRFLHMKLDRLPVTHDIARRRSRGLYKEFQERARFPMEMLERIYSEPLVSHFYSAGEILHFKARWNGDLAM